METAKGENALKWIERMNNIQTCARKVVDKEIIYQQGKTHDEKQVQNNLLFTLQYRLLMYNEKINIKLWKKILC